MTEPGERPTFEREWRRRFEARASRFEADHAVSGWSDAGLRRRLAVFDGLLDEGWLPAGQRVLELGCGAGTYVRLLAKAGHRVVGLDYSRPSLGRALAADPAGAGRYLAAEAYALPFAAGAFDAVLCIGVLQALAQPERALAEMARVLAPGGRALVETLNPWSPLAAWRRLSSGARRQATRLTYCAPQRVERALRGAGLHAFRHVAVLVPPRSLPVAERAMGQAWVARAARSVPGVRLIAPHAVWVLGSRS